jgi:DNA-binding transcriptional LysR family regulator
VLRDDSLFLVSRKKDAPGRKAISIANLDQKPLVMFPRPSTNRDLIERKARESGVALQCKYEISSSVVQLEFVRLGLAHSILPYFAVADHMAKFALAATPIKGLSLSQTLVWRGDRRQTAIVAELADAIRSIMRSGNSQKRRPK